MKLLKDFNIQESSNNPLFNQGPTKKDIQINNIDSNKLKKRLIELAIAKKFLGKK
jgi:hypothetical protein